MSIRNAQDKMTSTLLCLFQKKFHAKLVSPADSQHLTQQNKYCLKYYTTIINLEAPMVNLIGEE